MISGLLLTVAGACSYAARWYVEIVPLKRRLAAIGSSEFYQLPETVAPDNPRGLGGCGVIVRLAGPGNRQLLAVLPRGSGNLPSMRIWATSMVGDALGTAPPFPLQLDPPVLCDLDESMAKAVCSNGIPKALADAMRAAAAGSHGTGMWITSQDLAGQAPNTIRVDPAPYFP